MSIKHFGRVLGSFSGRNSSRRKELTQKHRQLRRLVAESLESRQLLAADLIPQTMVADHNYLIAEDVNADFRITPSDALIVLNEMARRGSGESNSSNASPNRFTDVNADGRLTPIDALIVLNRITRGEAEPDPLLSIELDVTQDGNSILTENTRNFVVDVGEKFDLEVRYSDLRDRLADNQFGAYSLYVDILATGIDSFLPVLSETQIVEVSENLVDAGGSLTLSFENQPDRKVEIPVSSTDSSVLTLENQPELAIQTAIEEGLGFGANTVSVSQAARTARDNGQVGTGDSFRYIIRFIGDDQEFVDVPNLIVDTSTLTGAAVTSSLSEVPVYTTVDQTQINPNSLLYNIDYRSSSLGNNVVYGDVRSGVYNPGNVETFDEIGGVGPAKANGFQAEVQSNPDLLQRFEAFSIELKAVRAQESVSFTLNLPDNPIGSEIALYGSSANADIALTPDMISIALIDDIGTVEDDRTGMVNGRFVIPTQLPITAVQDNVTLDEDALTTKIDVLANDLPSPTELSVLSVGAAAHGTSSIVNGEVFYRPAADYFGSDQFTYEISNGTNLATGTVVVDVRSINDLPEAERITIEVPRGGTMAIPYTSFLLPQPANEPRGISITSTSAIHGQVSNSTGSNLIYQAPTTNVATDTIDIAFSDGEGGGTTVIDVIITNPFGPTAEPDTITVNEDTATPFSVAVALLGNDTISTGSKRLSSIDTSNTSGTVVLAANGTFTYTPPANQFGTAIDSFRYVMSDGSTQSDPALVTINVLNINDAPVAGDQAATINTATTSSITIDLSSVISPGLGEAGVAGETVQISSVSNGDRGGQVSVASGATGVVYTPESGVTGIETFTYTVVDQLGLTATGTVTMTITNDGGGGTGGTASISGLKFNDANDNGRRDTGEATLPGWTIYLDLNNNGSLDTNEPSTVTDAQGEYRFDNLLASNYTVREMAQPGWRQTFPRTINSQSVSIDTGDYAGFTTVADIDQDGDLDVLVANEYSNSKLRDSNIVLLTNNGGGNFAQSTLALPKDARPQALIADQDFTGDGIADLVVASAGVLGTAAGGVQANGLQLFVGTATGFDPTWRFIPAGDGPSDVAAADLNGDGNLDLLVTNHRSDNLSILLGTGGGQFAAAVNLPTGDEPVAIATTRLAGNGGDLVAVANYRTGSVSIYSGSNGSLTLSNTIGGLTNPTDVVFVDIDQDNKVDLLVADSGTDIVRSYLGDGTGGFSVGPFKAVNSGIAGDSRERPEAIDVTDINNDGVPDLLVANRSGGESLWINNGNGTFSYQASQLNEAIPNFNPLLAKSIAVANLDGDDQLDYVVAFAAGGVSIHTTTVSANPGFYLLTLADAEAAVDNDFGNFQFANTPLANVSIAASLPTIQESGSPTSSNIAVSLSQPLNIPVTVTLGLAGTATRNSDYSISTTQITIPAGSTIATATITSLDDVIDEGAGETIIVSIESVVGAEENSDQQTTITIEDNDAAPLPSVQIATAPGIVSEGQSVTVTATLSAASAEDVTVTLGYASGTAVIGQDFTGATELIVPAGSTTATITLTTLEDGIDETDEAIIVDVLGVSGATELGVQSVSTTLVDVDATPPVVRLSTSVNSIAEEAGFTVITATLDSPTSRDVVIELAFSGTATLNADYITPTQIVIPAGNLTGAVSATAVNDLLDDDNESFNVEIFSASGATAAAQTPLNVVIVDDDAPNVSLVPDLTEIIEDGGITRLTAVLSSAQSTERIINLSFAGTAVAGRHYTVQSQRIVIPAGATSGSILVQAINNQEIENANVVIEITALLTNASTSITIRNEDGVSFPLRAEGASPIANAGSVATAEDIAALQAASLDIWQRAGLSAQGLDRLRNIAVDVDDLHGDLLGLAASDRIVIDQDGAGFGWFVDATPLDDDEFQDGGASETASTMDLLSVLLHEQGHLLGLGHDSSELMLEQLAAGTRRTPSSDDVDAALKSMF